MKCFSFVTPFYPILLMCLIYMVLEGGLISTNIGLEMGVAIGGDAVKVGKNIHFLMIMRAR